MYYNHENIYIQKYLLLNLKVAKIVYKAQYKTLLFLAKKIIKESIYKLGKDNITKVEMSNSMYEKFQLVTKQENLEYKTFFNEKTKKTTALINKKDLGKITNILEGLEKKDIAKLKYRDTNLNLNKTSVKEDINRAKKIKANTIDKKLVTRLKGKEL